MVTLDGKVPRARVGVANPLQLIWQHPEHAFDPRLRLEQSLPPAAKRHFAKLEVNPAWLSRFPHELSGGELQRLAIARVLGAAPRFICADEISTMLDAITRAQVWQALLDYCHQCHVGLIFTSHSEQLIDRIATRTLELEPQDY